MSTHAIIGLVGEKAAGKGTAATLLQTHTGGFLLRYSDPLRIAHVMQSRGKSINAPADLAAWTESLWKTLTMTNAPDIADSLYTTYDCVPPTTAELQTIGNQWRADHGTGVLTTILLAITATRPEQTIILDGIRNPGEIAELRRQRPGRHRILAIRADTDMRRVRLVEHRQRLGDPTTAVQFAALDDRDRGKNEADHGQQVQRCLDLVPEKNTLWNNGDTEEFEQAVLIWYRQRVEPMMP